MYIVSQDELQSGELQSSRVSQNTPGWAQIHANTMSDFYKHVLYESEPVKPTKEGKTSPYKAVRSSFGVRAPRVRARPHCCRS